MSGGPKILRKWAGGIALTMAVAALSQMGGRHGHAPAAPAEAKPLPDRQGGAEGVLARAASADRAAAPSPRAGVPAHAPPAPGLPAPRAIDCRKVKCVALTFDDGPIPGTAKLLGILKAHQARATFFLIGQQVAKYPEMVRREVLEGHQIGNHTWDHSDLSKLSDGALESQLSWTQDALKKASGGVTPVLLRPPYGSTNSRVAAMARKYKLAQVTWAVDPIDWKDHDSAKIERRVVDGTQQDYIVVMHDIQPTTVDAVPKILDQMKAKGVNFVTVAELFGATPLVPGELYTKFSGTAQGLP